MRIAAEDAEKTRDCRKMRIRSVTSILPRVTLRGQFLVPEVYYGTACQDLHAE